MMLKRVFSFLLVVCSSVVYAQNTASDTTGLSGLKQYPKKNTLPVRKPVLQLQPVEIPESELKLKVNYWRNWSTFGINMNQAAFSDNWSGGGVNSIAVGLMFNHKTDYTKDEKNYVSELIFQYGKLKNRDQLQRKTNDRIFWDNKVALKLSKSWYFFGSLNFESQFDQGYSYGKDQQGNETRTLISRFMSPGYLTESLGFEYKPNKYYYLRIGTGTARQTFVLDKDLYRTNPKNFGVAPGKVVRNELAFQLVSNYEKDIMENLRLKTRYAMFANYERLNNIDHRLDATLIAKVNRVVNVTISGIGVYDDDASDKIQASQTLALGLVYKFPNVR
ncbi:DUF3078 domain-containing protein [Pedobacter sp. SYSU D00535]|uniref:DUF3078 domain-containing protein n=1 Tax=Pedobacter sp. SYSU D00535 TaxID=2810308 RepID=UPI001A966C24|nr:DUF3078 domain-containing protein [Pedobacter sp. SYSU D00535]